MLGAYQRTLKKTSRVGRAGIDRWLLGLIAASAAAALVACGDQGNGAASSPPAPVPEPSPVQETPAPQPPPPAPVEPSPAPEAPAADTGGGEGQAGADLVARGKTVYGQACIACHNVDPTQPGTLGPAIAGSPLALVEARVVHAAYPEGYEPKRDTQMMVALPHLAPDVPALAAYLGSLGSSKEGGG